VRQQHTVERPGGGNQRVAVGRKDDLVDQRIDTLVGDAGIVAAVVLRRRCRAPEVALLIAR